MATSQEAAALLKTLTKAYPEKRIERETLQIYIENLADIPAYLLEAAVKDHIRNSPWFPKVSELRAIAASIANTRNFETVAVDPPPPIIPPEILPLIDRAQALEDAYIYEHRLNPPEWEALAADFDQHDRPFRARRVRQHLQYFLSIAPK